MFRKRAGKRSPIETSTEKKRKRLRIRPLLLGTALTAYTVFTLLDAFVIPKDIVTLESVQAAAASGSETAGSSAGSDESQMGSDGTSGQDSSSSGSEDGTRHKHKPNGRGGKGRSGKPGSSAASDGSSVLPGSSDKSGVSESTSGSDSASSDGSASTGGSTSSDGSASSGSADDASVITSDSYQADGVSITLTEERAYDTQIYIADIQLDDPSELLAGLADNSFGRNLSDETSSMAESLEAVLAINGDYYGFRDTGYVMRNGYLYRSTARSGIGNEDLVIYSDGSMEIIDESEVTAEELAAKGAVQIFSFGPGLISDGSVTVSEGDEVDQSMRSNPRTAIGMVEPGHYIMVVSDGRTDESAGLSLAQLAEVMKNAGCTEAYNLDGGGSSTMWFNGEIVNNPTGGRGSNERAVSDIVYIGK